MGTSDMLCIRDVYCRGCAQSVSKIYWISSLQKENTFSYFPFQKVNGILYYCVLLLHAQVKFLNTEHFMCKTILVKTCNNGVL